MLLSLCCKFKRLLMLIPTFLDVFYCTSPAATCNVLYCSILCLFVLYLFKMNFHFYLCYYWDFYWINKHQNKLTNKKKIQVQLTFNFMYKSNIVDWQNNKLSSNPIKGKELKENVFPYLGWYQKCWHFWWTWSSGVLLPAAVLRADTSSQLCPISHPHMSVYMASWVM